MQLGFGLDAPTEREPQPDGPPTRTEVFETAPALADVRIQCPRAERHRNGVSLGDGRAQCVSCGAIVEVTPARAGHP
jgi:hypothetical protein